LAAFLSHVVAWTAALALVFPGETLAQSASWPTRAVRIVVPFTAGGYTDTYARVIAQELSRVLGQPVVADNRPGGGGNLAGELVARSAPDGYTLLVAAVGMLATNASLYANLPFDPQRDFTPIAFIAEAHSVFVVGPTVPVNTVEELLRYARRQPGGLAYGSGGVGLTGHLIVESMKAWTGIDLRHVPYKGESELLPGVLRGDVAFASMSASTALPHVQSGRFRLIATTGVTRSSTLPDLPTLGETLPGLGGNSWVALVGPAGMPDDIVQRLNREVDRIMRSPEVQQRMAANAVAYQSMTPAQLGEFQRAETLRWGEVIRASRLRVE